MAQHHISLKDLASYLGVSISTVSRGLKNHPDISPEMCQRIQQLARDLHYSPNPLAMGLLKQQTRMIGVIVPDIVTHFFASIISGIEDVANKNGYFIVISSSNESYKKEAESVENMLKARVEGLIVCLSQETENYDHFKKLTDSRIPLVFFDRVCESLPCPSVTVDGFEAARRVTRHFFENGCSKIAYISGPPQLNISKNRMDGYLQGLMDCNLDFCPGYLEQCNLSANEATLATRRLLALPKKPDAVFGINDTVAFAAMREIKQQRFRIPEDIALVGFTDEFHSTVVDPQLTSVTHPTYQMGCEAAGLFFKCIGSKFPINKKIVLQAELVIRGSSLLQKQG